MSKNNLVELIDQFIQDVKPHLDDTFNGIYIDFQYNGRTYQLAVTDEAFSVEMMEVLHQANLKRNADKKLS